MLRNLKDSAANLASPAGAARNWWAKFAVRLSIPLHGLDDEHLAVHVGLRSRVGQADAQADCALDRLDPQLPG